MSVELWGLVVLVAFIGLMFFFVGPGRRLRVSFREMPAFDALGKAVERAVEAGERVHISLGTGSVIGSDSAPALVGLAVLSRVARATSMSDRPVVATAGDGAMAILAQDTLRTAYREVNRAERYDPTSGRLLGSTPFSYVAGLPLVLALEDVSVHMLNGSFGVEGALAADLGQRTAYFVIAGTDDIQTQALLYATAENPLIGEEVFASGAYLNVGNMHRASLQAQDWIRYGLIAVILLGVIVQTLLS